MDKDKVLKFCNDTCKNTLMETLSISFVDVGDDYITAKMPVTSKVYQPDGVLHGGGSFALAETVGSVAAVVFEENRDSMIIRGLEMSGNHLKSVSSGDIYATARALHKGRTTQVWDIKIVNDNGLLISVFKLTTICLPKAK